MTASEARSILAAISGYWPTPVMTDEEAAAWLRELASGLKFTSEEAQSVIDAWARHGAEFRPRPGQLVAEIQALRRRRLSERNSQALLAGDDFEVDDELRAKTLAECRVAIEAGRKHVATLAARARERAA